MPTRHAQATWKSDLKSGSGWFNSETGSVGGTFSAGSRFEEADGTNPEELIGAAHAGCFSMALSLVLGGEGYVPEWIETSADVEIQRKGDGFAITGTTLRTQAKVPGVDEASFAALAQKAKDACPVGQALKAIPVRLTATLAS